MQDQEKTPKQDKLNLNADSGEPSLADSISKHLTDMKELPPSAKEVESSEVKKVPEKKSNAPEKSKKKKPAESGKKKLK